MTANDLTETIAPHYATKYQHWDLVIDTGMGYFNGCATKYVSRWRKKHGIEDLKKALHFTNKLIEWGRDPRHEYDTTFDPDDAVLVGRFAAVNGLQAQEAECVLLLVQCRSEGGLIEARELILALMDQAEGILPEKEPVPLEDSNKHADRPGYVQVSSDPDPSPGRGGRA